MKLLLPFVCACSFVCVAQGTFSPEKLCEDVAVQVPDTCTREKSVNESFACDEEETKEVCKNAPVEKQETCTKHVTAKEAYSCDESQFKTDCKMVPKICNKTEKISESYACEKQECNMVNAEIDDTCYKPTQVPFPCQKTRLEKVCKMVPGPNTCTRTEMRTQSYACPKTEYRQQCKQVSQSVSYMQTFTPSMSLSSLSENCRPKMRSECTDVSVDVADTCTSVQVQDQAYTCTRTEMQQKCQQTPTLVPSMCTRSVRVAEDYDCSKTEYKTECVKEYTSKTPCKGKHCNLRRLKGEDKASKCSTTPVLVPKTCTKQVQKEQAYKCEKTQLVEQCQQVPVEIPQTCHKSVEVPVSVPCTKSVIQKKCAMVTDYGTPVECKKMETSEKCEQVPFVVEETCQKEMSVQVPERCADVEVCTDETIPYTDTCVRDEQTPYACKKNVQKQMCQAVPSVCNKMVDIMVPYDCPFEECNKIEYRVERTCYRDVKKKESYPCKKTKTEKVCEQKVVKKPKTCMRAVTRMEEYSCTKTVHRQECKQLVQVTPLAIALDEPKKCKGKECKHKKDDKKDN